MKTKRFLAVLVTCVFAFVVCAVPAMAKVIPTVPGEKASVALEVLNTDGTDCEGNIKQTAAQQSRCRSEYDTTRRLHHISG